MFGSIMIVLVLADDEGDSWTVLSLLEGGILSIVGLFGSFHLRNMFIYY